MIITAIRHPVQNYDTWKAVYDTMPPTSRGAKFSRVNRSVDDSNMVVVVAGFDSLDEAEAFLGSAELREKMGEAGVIGEPRIEIYEEVEAI